MEATFSQRATKGALTTDEVDILYHRLLNSTPPFSVPVPTVQETLSYTAQKREDHRAKSASNDQPPRAINSYMLFSARFHADPTVLSRCGVTGLHRKHANQLAGATWRDLRGSGTSPAFLPWTHLAKVVDEDHKQAYPGYIYRKRNRRKGRPEPPLAGTSTSNSTVEAGVASQSRAQVCHD